ncbi:hypothetical protein E4K67_04200 [Desulfosporosinus fructosivorans]|uniref:Uncharacterized protein n=1 Tax=Desulfosporosinus fructosivorans TaxID=2018669 RepID=A0A4Z0RAS4_9FIRM|nr:hypothetical protein [Desulfosporosinus fructosivorans]TGE38696.1 hypothetical protein E4K67_04200 [Desulfosporosinus fructosivorans]
MIYNIFNYIKQHPEVIWSGCGVAFVLFMIPIFKFLFEYIKTHMIINKSEYEKLIKTGLNFVDINELKSNLEFVNEFGIYMNSQTNEKFCPTCLTNKKVLNHLTESMTEFGLVYHCHVCPQYFRDKGFNQRMDQANQIFM